MKWRWLILVLFLVVDGMVGAWWWNRWRERRYDPVILESARKYGVDPGLLKAVVWRESRFKPHVRGKAGERGLMQIREMAAQEWADAERIDPFEPESLMDPKTNLCAGAYYLQRLIRRYGHTDNPIPYALADFNAGRSNVLKWNRGPALTNAAVFVAQIGFPTTRKYVEDILARWPGYQRQLQRRNSGEGPSSRVPQ